MCGGVRLYVTLGMVLAIAALGVTAALLKSRLDAKQAAIESLAQQLSLASGDAARWQEAAVQRQGVIDRQLAALRRLESDGEAARAIAAAGTAKAAERIASLEARISQLKESARAKPEDVRLLGPVVRGALPGLQQH